MKKRLLPLEKAGEFQIEKSFSEELPYWEFSENEVILVDGTLVAGVAAQGINIETVDTNQLNQITLELRSWLGTIPDSFELSFVYSLANDYDELIATHSKLRGTHEVANWLTKERIKSLKHAQSNQALLKPTLHIYFYQRYQGTNSSSKLSFFSSPKTFTNRRKEEYQKSVIELHQVVDGLSSVLSAMGMKTRKMSGDEAFQACYKFLNPGRQSQNPTPRLSLDHRSQEFRPEEIARVPALNLPSPRQQLVFSDLITLYDSIFYDGQYTRCISLTSLPEYTHAALVSKLMQLPFPHTLHVHIRVPEQSKELSLLQAKRRMAHSMSISQGGRANDLESEARLSSAEDLLRELINTGQKIFYFQFVVLIQAPTRDELEMQTKATLAKIRELNGAEGLVETVGTFKVWKTLLPFGNTTSVRSRRVKADNLADLIPVYGPYDGRDNGKPICLFQNRSSGLVQYDPFDAKLPNYNSLVTGSSGAGKSFVNNLVLLQYVSQDPLIFIIDIGGSYRKLCEVLDGQYLEVLPPKAGEIAQAINPFALPPGHTVPAPEKVKFLLSFLESILTDEGGKLSKLDRSLLEESVISLYSKKAGSPRLSELATELSLSKDVSLRNFSRMLYPWTGDRPYGRLLDGQNSFDVTKNVVVFDLKGLSTYPDLQSVMLLIITDFILGRVETIRHKRKQILMDECWELLKSPGSQNFMEYCVRTLRKTGSGITFITQGLEEIVRSPIGPAILSNTATKFVLMQKGDLEPSRSILKLNEQELGLISSLRQVKGSFSEAFLMANDSRTVIRVVPTALEYWLATSDAADNELLEKTRKEHPARTLIEVIEELARLYPKGAARGVR